MALKGKREKRKMTEATAGARPVTHEDDEVGFVGKLSCKTLGCNPAMVKTLPQTETKLAIARIYGTCTGVGVQEDKEQGKAWTFLKGNFEGINMQDGTTLRSGKLYLPEGVSQLVEQTITEIQQRDGVKAVINFAFEIRAVKANNRAGYSYEAAQLVKPEQDDPLEALRKLVKQAP